MKVVGRKNVFSKCFIFCYIPNQYLVFSFSVYNGPVNFAGGGRGGHGKGGRGGRGGGGRGSHFLKNQQRAANYRVNVLASPASLSSHLIKNCRISRTTVEEAAARPASTPGRGRSSRD